MPYLGWFIEMLSYFLDVLPHADKIFCKGDVRKFVLNDHPVSENRIVLNAPKLICMRTPRCLLPDFGEIRY
jgi:hypothetical protein